MLKFNPTELTCDFCHTLHCFEETVDFYDFKDFIIVMENIGWKSFWNKERKAYYHKCPDCITIEIQKFNKLKIKVKEDLFSVEKSKNLL